MKLFDVDKEEKLDICLRLLEEFGLNESILVADDCKNQKALNSNDQTQGCNRATFKD